MPASDSRSVRNGVIATVIGGIALAVLGEMWPPAKKAGMRLWDQATWFVSLFADSYSVQGWFLAVLALLALITIVRLFVGFARRKPPAFANYVEDQIFGAKWRWSWIASEISNLWCFCPRCDSELVYDDSSCHSIYSSTPAKTDFICEHCNRITVASVPDGNKGYAVSAVQREIRRRLRTNEHTLPTPAES
jgi:hypothetical protein